MNLTFIDFFAGIGGFRIGLEQAGHKCIGFCEIDKFAVKSYKAMHNTEGEWYVDDIRKARANELPRADMWTAGFPCQDISVAGKQLGFKGKRSSLFFTVAGLVESLEEEDKPSYLVLENVKNLLSINRGLDFAKLLTRLDEIGYDAEWDVLQSSEIVPQNRERVYIIGHLRGRSTGKVFPITNGNGEDIELQEQGLKQIIGGSQGNRTHDPRGTSVTLSSRGGGQGAQTGLYAIPVSDVAREKKVQNGRRCKEDGEPMLTLTGQDRHGVIIQRSRGFNKGGVKDIVPTLTKSRWEDNNHLIDGFKIRKLTPKECFRLQGFPDEYFEKAAEANSNNQLYKQAGNSVTVPVVRKIGEKLKIETQEETP